MNRRPSTPLWLSLGLAFTLCACAPTGPNSRPLPEDGWLHLDLGRRASLELIGYYAGGMLSPASDPVEAGLVVHHDDAFYLNLDSLAVTDSLAADQLRSAASGESSIEWDAFAAFLEDMYPRFRRQPPTVGRLFEEAGFDGPEDADWISVEVTGVMSTMRRRVSIERARLADALERYDEEGEAIVYGRGTVFIAEHIEDGVVREVTAMEKRTDGHWDFHAYGPDGTPARQTAARPRALRVPTQCVGCHFGSKLYEPEKSFPAPAADGPHGPRALHVGASQRNPAIVQFFDEHRKRSDHVLGLYATLYVSELLAGGPAAADSVGIDLEFLPQELWPR